MKRNMKKAVLSLMMAGTIAFSGVGAQWTGMDSVEAAKILTQATPLSQVSGVTYDAVNERIVWNRVPGATEYYVTLTDSEGYTSGSWSTTSLNMAISNFFSYTSWTKDGESKWYYDIVDGSYTVTITAKDTSGYYIVASNVSYDERFNYDYDTSTSEKSESGVRRYTLYKYPVSAPASATIQLITKKQVTNSITQLPSIAIKEVSEAGVVVKIPDATVLNVDERVYWQYSNNAQFSKSGKGNFASETYSYGEDGQREATIEFSNFAPDETIYVRARVYNPNYDNGSSYTSSDDKYSSYTAHITYQMPKLEVSSAVTRVTANAITISATLKNNIATGYQFAKKSGSKWVTLGQQTSPTFVDEGLAKDKTYEYRVRAYYYNSKTKKTIWSDWYQTKATTWGANLNAKAEAASATSVKLTWKPVTGAEGYEIYRCETNSSVLNYENGIANESYANYTLVKTLKGAKKKTYTDKKLVKGNNYYYEVRAYKTIGKQKYYIYDSVSVSLKATGLSGVVSYQKANGQVVATWNKMTGIKGYYVEKYDRATGQYTTVKKLKASATSYTFAKVNMGSDSVQYRIRPYSAKYVYDGYSVTVAPTLAAATGVKAVRKDNGVQVSWKPVAGADYYRVYRTTDSDYTYNKTTKSYTYYNGQTVYEGAVNTTGCRPELSTESSDGYKWNGTYSTYKITGTSVLDTALPYQKRSVDEKGNYIQVGQMSDGSKIYQTEEAFYNGIEGPEPGATYYYYVVAYAYATNGSTEYTTISGGRSKAAEITFTNANAKKVSKITSAASSKKGQAIIKYKKVKGVDGYAVFRSTKKNGTYTLVGTSKKTSFTDITAESGKTYYYKVASYVEGEAKANIYSKKTAAKKVKVK